MSLQVPIDPKDRHVVASAVAGGAAEVLTFNLCHFPRVALAPLGVTAVSPASFLSRLLKEQPDLMRAVIVRERRHSGNRRTRLQRSWQGWDDTLPDSAAQAMELLRTVDDAGD